MTCYRSNSEENALENEARLRAQAAGIEQPGRSPEESRDDYHSRIWAALQQVSQG